MERRRHSSEFKQQIVQQILSGAMSMARACREHNLAPSMVDRWKQKFKAGTLLQGTSGQDTVLMTRIAELERMVGRLALENDFLKKAAAYMDQHQRRCTSPVTAKTLAASRKRAK